MKSRTWATLFLLLLTIAAGYLAFRSFDRVNRKLNNEFPEQSTMVLAEQETAVSEETGEPAENTVEPAEEAEEPAEETAVSAEDTAAEAAAEQVSETAETEDPAEEEAASASGAPVLVLTGDRVELTAGDSFDPLSCVSEVRDDKDDSAQLKEKIKVTGYYDTSAAGEYILRYLVADSDGNLSETVRVTLVVK